MNDLGKAILLALGVTVASSAAIGGIMDGFSQLPIIKEIGDIFSDDDDVQIIEKSYGNAADELVVIATKEYIVYNEDGWKEFVVNIDESGNYQGLWTKFGRDGSIIYVANYKNNVRDKVYEEKINYSDGALHGEHIEYGIGGVPKTPMYFDQGNQDGVVASIKPNTQVTRDMDNGYTYGFSKLSIKSVATYPNLLDSIEIVGEKDEYKFPSKISLSNSSIYNFLNAGVKNKNIDPIYLEKDYTWSILPIKDMQPGWEYTYSPLYFPKYYAFPPLTIDNKKLNQKLAGELETSPWPKDGLKRNFGLIFNNKTPVYINDLMFAVGRDSEGFHGSNILGLTRFGLPEKTSKTKSAIHLSMAKISVKTLVHEYLHDKIRFDTADVDLDHVLYNNMPLLGLSKTWDDDIRVAFRVRDVIDKAYANSVEAKKTWWEPLANDDEFTSNYSFTRDDDLDEENISKNDLWDVMQFMEELIVRIVAESLYKQPVDAVISVINEIDGLYDELNTYKTTIPTLVRFVDNYYGYSRAENQDGLTNMLLTQDELNELDGNIIEDVFSEVELALINKIVKEAVYNIRRMRLSKDKAE